MTKSAKQWYLSIAERYRLTRRFMLATNILGGNQFDVLLRRNWGKAFCLVTIHMMPWKIAYRRCKELPLNTLNHMNVFDVSNWIDDMVAKGKTPTDPPIPTPPSYMVH